MVSEAQAQNLMGRVMDWEKIANAVFEGRLKRPPRPGWREAVVKAELLDMNALACNVAKPLIESLYPAPTELAGDGLGRLLVGKPLISEKMEVGGNAAGEALWVLGSDPARLQVMSRLLMIIGDTVRVADVYSQPVTRTSLVVVSGTDQSQARISYVMNLLNFCADHKVKAVLGWLDIEEISQKQLPNPKRYL